MKFYKGMLCVILLLCITFYSLAEDIEIMEAHPLISPEEISLEYKKCPGIETFAIFGLDLGTAGNYASGYKEEIEEAHADAAIIIVLNYKENKIDLISIPRDTFTYVPGVRGVYKFNGAVNCADGTVRGGLEKLCETASWVLGGVPIKRYVAVDMQAMADIGGAMGGIDFEIEMTYYGYKGRKYTRGMTHLDGWGILDYLRARKNATVNGTDLGRTNRQRELIMAIINKLAGDKDAIIAVADSMAFNESGIFSNIALVEIVDSLMFLYRVGTENLGSHVLEGTYRTAPMGWNFTYTDMENRNAIIKEVFGIDNPTPMENVSYDYSKWLEEFGFRGAHYMNVAAKFELVLAKQKGLTQEQKQQVEEFKTLHEEMVQFFYKAATTATSIDSYAYTNLYNTLREMGENLEEELELEEKMPWKTGLRWFEDENVNQYVIDWN